MIRKGFGIKNIAEMLGVSVSTVSRALRDAHDVNPQTKEKVLALAKELNFTLNKNASALASGSTKNIGVIIPYITNYYFSTVISGIQEEAYKLGYNIILFVTNDDYEKERQLILNMDLSSLDGLLISISSNSCIVDHFRELIESGFPIVFFDRVPETIEASKVMQNDFEGAYLATLFLLRKGYKKIACLVGPSQLNFSIQRVLGYKKALKLMNIEVDQELIVYSGFSQEDGYQDTLSLFEKNKDLDAVFAINDRKAVGAIQLLKKKGYKVGSEFGVIGFTNDPISTIIEPNLTTIEEPALEIGKQSFQLLIKHIKNQTFEYRSIVIPCRLIERDSA